MAKTEKRVDERSGDGGEGANREADHQAQQDEVLRKMPDQAAPDQEWGERHATGKGTATGGGNPRKEND